MIISKNSDKANFSKIQIEYKKRLLNQISEMEEILNSLGQKKIVKERFSRLFLLATNILNSIETFGGTSIDYVVRKIQFKLQFALNARQDFTTVSNSDLLELVAQVSELKEISLEWEPTLELPASLINVNTIPREHEIYFLIEYDKLLAVDLISQLEAANYKVTCFHEVSKFGQACKVNKPGIIIIETASIEGIDAHEGITHRMSNGDSVVPLVIFISDKDNIETRMAVAKAGGNRHFCKPLESKKLIQAIDSFLMVSEERKLRVLIFEEDEILLEFYKTLLMANNLDVLTQNNSLNGLESLTNFEPDLVVLSIDMAKYSGLTLAKIFRQDDRWKLTPILFLCSKKDLNSNVKQIETGDDYIIKPINSHQFLSTVTFRASKSREAFNLRKKLISEVSENELRFSSVNQHNLVSETDISGNITNVNNKFLLTSGYKKEELVGGNYRILKSGVHDELFYSEMWRVISQGKIWRGTICNRKKDGQLYWLDSTIMPYLDEIGRPYKYVSVLTDITKLHTLKNRLKQSQEFANIGTWDWNVITGELYWSDQIWPMFGYTREVTETTFENFSAAIHPDDRDEVAKAIKNCVENDENYDIEHRVVWMDGSVHWLHSSGNVVKNEKSEPENMLGILRNIDVRKNIEEKLKLSRREAENANRAKSKFLSNMSHELRTPMNAIMGYGQILKINDGASLNISQLESVDEILKASHYLLTLIDELLTIAKIESGNETYNLEDVDICFVIGESLKLMSGMMRKRGIRVEISISGKSIISDQLGEQSLYVLVDKMKLKQVLINLLSNAVKYNSENGLISLVCDCIDSDFVSISVADTGAGLSTEKQLQLFKSFERLGEEDNNTEGTGLGLTIVHSIVKGMNGKMGIESEVGKGSRFWVEFPKSRID